MIEWDNPKLTIKEQAGLLSVNRTGLYRQNKEPSELEIKIKHLIDKIHTDKPFKGSRRIRDDINDLKLGSKSKEWVAIWIFLYFPENRLCIFLIKAIG